MAFSFTTVTASYGAGATGTVRFVLDTPISNGGDAAGAGAAWVATLDGSGNISQSLPSTMDASTRPQGARMKVHEVIIGRTDRIYYVQIPTSGPVALGALERSDYSVGESVIDRRLGNISNVTAVSSGTVEYSFADAQRTETVGSLRLYTGTTAAAATPTLCRAGIYTVDASDNLTLVASIANDTTLFAAASTAYVRSLSSPWYKVAGVRYAIGILVVSGATMPSFQGMQGAVNGTDWATVPRITATQAGQSDLPSSVAAGSLSASLRLVQTVLLP